MVLNFNSQAISTDVKMARPGSRINSSTEASEEICVASLSDYQAVVDIDKHVCHGLDRLPGQFSSYVDGPGAGFVSALLMDGGLTLGTTAGRLAPDCRGSVSNTDVKMARPRSRLNSSTEASEEICVANLSDYQAVVDIDNHVCHGLDRLPGQFSSYVDGPGVQGYTYKKGERIVGFVSALLMDGGLTLGTTAGRLAPDCRGSGMYGRFKRRLLEQYYREHPETLHYTITVDNTNNKAETDTRLLAKFARVLEKTPSGSNVSTSNRQGDEFSLLLPNPVSGGNYTCHAGPDSPAARCLPKDYDTPLGTYPVGHKSNMELMLEGRMVARAYSYGASDTELGSLQAVLHLAAGDRVVLQSEGEGQGTSKVPFDLRAQFLVTSGTKDIHVIIQTVLADIVTSAGK
nr:hypothetical protein BaRGS_002476 [Batillaria attramentaria]